MIIYCLRAEVGAISEYVYKVVFIQFDGEYVHIVCKEVKQLVNYASLRERTSPTPLDIMQWPPGPHTECCRSEYLGCQLLTLKDVLITGVICNINLQYAVHSHKDGAP